MYEKSNGEVFFTFSEPTSGFDISICVDSIGRIYIALSVGVKEEWLFLEM